MNYRLTKASEANARMTRVCETCHELFAYHCGWDERCPNPKRYERNQPYFLEGRYFKENGVVRSLKLDDPTLIVRHAIDHIRRTHMNTRHWTLDMGDEAAVHLLESL